VSELRIELFLHPMTLLHFFARLESDRSAVDGSKREVVDARGITSIAVGALTRHPLQLQLELLHFASKQLQSSMSGC